MWTGLAIYGTLFPLAIYIRMANRKAQGTLDLHDLLQKLAHSMPLHPPGYRMTGKN